MFSKFTLSCPKLSYFKRKIKFYRPESWQAEFPKYRARLRLVQCISVQSFIKAVVEFCRHNATREPYPLSTRLYTFDLLQFLYNPQRSCLHRMCRVIERFKKRRKITLYILYFKYWLFYCDFTRCCEISVRAESNFRVVFLKMIFSTWMIWWNVYILFL